MVYDWPCVYVFLCRFQEKMWFLCSSMFEIVPCKGQRCNSSFGSLMITLCTTRFNSKKSYIQPKQCPYIFGAWFLEQSVIISMCISNFLVLITKLEYINKIQQDATVCRYLFVANLLYMFRVSVAPIIRSTQNCNCSLWYRS